MKPVDVKSRTYIDFNKNIDKEDPKSIVGHHHKNVKTVFQKVMFRTGAKKFLKLEKLKILCSRHATSDLNGEEIIGTFSEK